MTDQINAEWHVSEVNNPVGYLTIAYIENGHAIRMNIRQPEDAAKLEEAVLQSWPHDTFKIIHASGVAPHPMYAKMLGERRVVASLKRLSPADPISLPAYTTASTPPAGGETLA